MIVLGIETSCDETGIALYGSDATTDTAPRLLAHTVYSQVKTHAAYGGVVPELASRDHVRKTLPLIRQTLAEAGLTPRDIDGVAYTAGPGLVGALLVGATLGRTLAWALNVPALAVHHMEAHLLAPLLEDHPPAFPFLALLVSGGHSQLVQVKGLGEYRVLGESLDDAAGEAFDKTAKLLGLPYPGGPALARLAEQDRAKPVRQEPTLTFPRPMTDRPGLDMSFSGLKTAALTAWRKRQPTPENAAAVARAFEDAVVDTLAIKCRRAMAETGLSRLIIAGGVGANRRLRARLSELAAELDGQVFYPRPAFCTDNGAMIALAGYQRLRVGQHDTDRAIRVSARWSLEQLAVPAANARG